jgi:hypothetical protein
MKKRGLAVGDGGCRERESGERGARGTAVVDCGKGDDRSGRSVFVDLQGAIVVSSSSFRPFGTHRLFEFV